MTKKHKSTKIKPFYAVYGREARTPLDKDENKITILESNRRMAYIRLDRFETGFKSNLEH